MALFSTAYFPTVTYMAAFAGCDEVQIEACETYPKQTYRNRTVIATANGLLPLTVNVTKPNGNHTLTKDITICRKENWPVQHWRAIESAYNASPYFQYYADDIHKLIFGKHAFLLDLNMDTLHFLVKKLRINTSANLTADFVSPADATDDYRNVFSPKAKDKISLPPYPQVFEERYGFVGETGILDLLFNLGPESRQYLNDARNSFAKH